MVTETLASARPRVVGSVGWAGAEPTPPIRDLEAVSATVLSDDLVEVDFGSGERAVVDVRGRPRQAMVVGRWTACGPGVRLFRAADDGSRLAGESIVSIDGVVELDRPGPIALTRTAGGVHAWAEGGFHLEPAWAGFAGRTVQVREIDEAWSSPTPLDEVGRVPAGLVRRLRRSTGRRLLELRVGP